MKKTTCILALLLILAAVSARTDYYVAQDGQTPIWPYTNWTMAASNIQDALTAATNGATVWVAAGVYRTPTNAVVETGVKEGTNVVYIEKALTLLSVDGPAATFIDGSGSNRCVSFNVSSAALDIGPAIIDGFTITNGYSFRRGGGVYLSGSGSTTGIVQNCIITGNILQQGTNAAYCGGGGLYAYSSAFFPIVSNCVVRGNHTILGSEGTSSGGGLWFRANGLIVDCIFEQNTSSQDGGAMYLRSPKTIIDRCIIISNTAALTGGAIVMRNTGFELRNSFVAYNMPAASAIYTHTSEALQIYNSTVVSNRVLTGSGVNNADFQNNIMDNLALNANTVITGYNNCLPSIPTVGEWHNTVVTTNNPSFIGFVDPGAGNFRLRNDSPCVNAGINQPGWLAEAMDLDRRRRIDVFSGLVDIGCYEYIPRGSMYNLR